MSRWTNAVLEPMRNVGDPKADAVLEAVVEGGKIKAVNHLMRNMIENDDIVPDELPNVVKDFLEETAVLPDWADQKKIKIGEHLFSAYGPEIIMLLFCASLPFCYAAAKGAHVLYATKRMVSNLERRIFETAQFLLDVMEPGSFDPDGRAIRAIQKVRLMHAAIRYYVRETDRLHDHWDDDWGQPINQEDLAGTLMSFSATVIRGMRKLGGDLTAVQEDAYLHTWNVVGHLLGIQSALLPTDVDDALALMDAIGDRHWAPSQAGKDLTHALIHFMEYHLPGRFFDGLPSSTIRELSGDKVADILDVPKGDWTRHLLKLQRVVSSLADDFIPMGIEPLTAVFSRKLIEAVVWVERGGKRSPFQIPSQFQMQWGLTGVPSAFFKGELKAKKDEHD